MFLGPSLEDVIVGFAVAAAAAFAVIVVITVIIIVVVNVVGGASVVSDAVNADHVKLPVERGLDGNKANPVGRQASVGGTTAVLGRRGGGGGGGRGRRRKEF